MAKDLVSLTVKIPRELSEKINQAAGLLEERDGSPGAWSRSAVVRAALVRGLEELTLDLRMR